MNVTMPMARYIIAALISLPNNIKIVMLIIHYMVQPELHISMDRKKVQPPNKFKYSIKDYIIMEKYYKIHLE